MSYQFKRIPLPNGTRVVLPANEEEGWDEERGEVVNYDARTDTYIIQLDPQYYQSAADDGIREVSGEDVCDSNATFF